METVDHHGRTTAYRQTTGQGAPEKTSILYVHGSGATHRAWAHQYAPDGPAHPAVAVDLSGHGDSADVPTDPGPETLSAYVEDVTATASATDADVLVGNSLGGAVALQAVLEGSVTPEALVLVGTGAKLAVHERLRKMLAEDFESAVEFLHDDMLFHDAAEGDLERSKDEMRAVGPVTRRDFLTCHQFDVRDRLGAIDVPSLAICGEHDQLTPPNYHEFLAKHLQNGTFETISGAAHLVMVNRPAEFNDRLAAFLDRHCRL